MSIKSEIRNSLFDKLKAPGQSKENFGVRRWFHRFRLPLRESSDIAQAAARNRAESLFQVTYRSTWTR